MANDLTTNTGGGAMVRSEPGTTLGQLITRNSKAIASVLPKHVTPERIARMALAEARRNPKLLEADAGTFIGALIQAASLGLEPGPAGLSYLVPRWNKHTGVLEVQFQAGYKGLMQLARNSGQVGSFMAEVVRTGDEFSFALGTAPHLTHRPAMGERGEVTHVYAVAHLHRSDDWQFVVMTKSEVEAVRRRSQAQGFSPWSTDWDEMAKKTAIRRLCKYLPMSAEMLALIAQEEALEAGQGMGSLAYVPDGLELPSVSPSTGAPLAARMAQAEDASVEPAGAQGAPEGDDWDLLGLDDLVVALEEPASKSQRWKKAYNDCVARGDVEGLRELARAIHTRR